MSVCSIVKSSFCIQPLDEQSYELGINFLSVDGEISKKSFIFIQKSNPQEGAILDVFTKNGTCQSDFLKKLFRKSDVEEAENASVQLKNYNKSGPVLAVLDLKDPHKGYLPCTQCSTNISDHEEIVCDFFKKENKITTDLLCKISDCFKKKLEIDFILCEGSLKSDLLKKGGFSQSEIAFFNSKAGSENFCQCAEYFMNGFKHGQSAITANKIEFIAEKYIKPVSAQFDTFQPYKLSTVFYPVYYKDLYSNESVFANSLKPFYNVNGKFDSATGITVMQVEKKS